MGFGTLMRSLSDSKRRPEQSRHKQQAHKRSNSTQIHPRTAYNANNAMAVFQRAKEVYEAEHSKIMRDEIDKRNKNDLECKRHMKMIERRLQAEKKSINDVLITQTNTAIANYRAGKLSVKDLNRQQTKLKLQSEARLASLAKWQKEEQGKAQRIFFSRGEEIGANTGRALRIAKAKMERDQKIAI